MSNKSVPKSGRETSSANDNHHDQQQQQPQPLPPPQYPDPRPYVVPISPAPFIHPTPAHQYHHHQPTLSSSSTPYFYSQDTRHSFSQAAYSQPTLFASNPYLSQPPEFAAAATTTGDNNYASQMLDGMQAKAARNHRQDPAKRDRKEEKQKQKNRKREGGENDGAGNTGTLRDLLFDTLQQEVTALEVLRKQIAQFAVITQNAEKYCDMDRMNPVLARQGLLNVVPPAFLAHRPPPPPHFARHHQQQFVQRPVTRQVPHQLPPQFRQPPPAHMGNYLPRRAAHPPPLRPGNPMQMACQTLHDVEDRLRNCEKAVANKIELYERHVKRGRGKMDARDVKNMAVRTLQDIEQRLKVTERNMDGKNRRAQKDKER